MATNRVINLRIIGLIRRLRYPSITICPASVPVTVELCPAAINAMANKVGAMVDPASAIIIHVLALISATSVLPVLKNTVAASMSIAAFIRKAMFNAMALSIKFHFNACFNSCICLCLSFLFAPSAECRYRLCGITVAPIIPMAIYNAVSLVRHWSCLLQHKVFASVTKE